MPTRGSPALALRVARHRRGLARGGGASAFEPYFSTKEPGVGLGLALTRRIVERHGGTVALDTAPRRGTTVPLLLPLRAPQPAPEPLAQGASA